MRAAGKEASPESPEASERTRVLLVCRTRRQCAKLGLWFDRIGVQFEARTGLDEAVDVVTSNPPSAIVVQWSLTDRRGQRAIDLLRDAMSARAVPLIALCRTSRAARAALEAGAEDITNEGETFEITTDLSAFEPVKKALERELFFSEAVEKVRWDANQ